MKHFFTRMLMMIAPMVVTAKTTTTHSKILSNFVIQASDQVYSANPSPANPFGGCMATVIPTASVSGNSTCSQSDFMYYEVTIDLLGDGTTDYIASSAVRSDWIGAWHFDAADNIFKTYLPAGNKSDYTLLLPSIALTQDTKLHNVVWKIYDLCGDTSQANSTISVIDKKAPTPYCVSVSGAFFQTNSQYVEFWARDFDKGAMDNCSLPEELFFTFDGAAPIKTRINEDHFYKIVDGKSVNASRKEYMEGNAYKWLPAARSVGKMLNCESNELRIDVWDRAYNTDYCTVILNCKQINGKANIYNFVRSVKGKPVENAYIMADANIPEFPKGEYTDKDGKVDFSVPNSIEFNTRFSASYTTTKKKGVDLKDYVLLKEHLNGTKQLKYFWQYIAGDINKDKILDINDLNLMGDYLSGGTNLDWIVIVDEVIAPIDWNTYKTERILDEEDGDFYNNFLAIKLGDLDGNAYDQDVDILDPKIISEADSAYWRK
ncbi:MAG: hypothetical protein IPJ39_21620 [Saprospiraceae bacterium]|nr:hypothetical protein [Saprospiraceae bacterium]